MAITVEELQILVTASTDEAVKPLNEMLNKINNLMNNAFRPIQSQTNQAAKTVSNLSQSYAKVGNSATQSMDQMSKSLDNVNAQIAVQQKLLEGLKEKHANISSLRGSDSSDALGLESKILGKESQIDGLINKSDDLASRMWDYEDALSGAGEASETASGKLGKLMSFLGGIGQKVTGAAKALGPGMFSKLADGMKTLPGLFGKVALGGTGLTFAFKGLKSIFTGVTDKLSKFTKMFGLMLMRMAAKQIIQAAGEEIKNLAKYSSSFNAAMSEMQSSVQYAGRSLITALAPAIQAITPLITWLTNAIAQLAAWIGQLFGALTGAKSFVKAKKTTTDFAKGVDKGTKATKEANKEMQKYLAGFDELNVIETSKDSGSGNGSGGGGGPNVGDMFETVPIDSKFSELADKIKSIASRIFEPFKKAWKTHGQNVIEAWKYGLSSVWDVAQKMGTTWLKVWENGTGERLVGNILLLVQELGLWIGDIAVAWGKAWDNHGEALIQSKYDMLNNILELIYSISGSFREAWNDGAGEQILGNIMQTVTNINKIVGNFAENFKKAWKENDVGKGIAEGFLKIIEKISEVAKNITGRIADWAGNVNLNPFLESVKNLLGHIWPLIEKIGDLLVWLWDAVLAPILTGFIENILPTLLDGLGSIADVLGGVIDFIVGVFTMDWGRAWEGIKNIFGGVRDFIEGIGHRLVQAISDRALEMAKFTKEKFIDPVDRFFRGLWDGIKNVFSGIGSWFSDRFNDAKNGILNAFSSIGSFFSGVWNGIKNVFGNISGWFRKQFSGAWEAVKNVFSSGGRIFDGIKDGILNGLKTVINGLIGGINKVITIPFKGINAALRGIKNISIMGAKPFGWIQEFNIPSIPKLAKGGVISESAIVNVGEYAGAKANPEIVSPQSIMHDTVVEANTPMFNFLGSLIQELIVAVKDQELDISLDGASLAQKARPYFEKENWRSGSPIISGGGF